MTENFRMFSITPLSIIKMDQTSLTSLQPPPEVNTHTDSWDEQLTNGLLRKQQIVGCIWSGVILLSEYTKYRWMATSFIGDSSVEA